MIEPLAAVPITEAALARDIHAVPAKVQAGLEIIVEQDHRPVAVIKTPQSPERENQRVYCSGKGVRREARLCSGPDIDFAKDVQADIAPIVSH